VASYRGECRYGGLVYSSISYIVLFILQSHASIPRHLTRLVPPRSTFIRVIYTPSPISGDALVTIVASTIDATSGDDDSGYCIQGLLHYVSIAIWVTAVHSTMVAGVEINVVAMHKNDGDAQKRW